MPDNHGVKLAYPRNREMIRRDAYLLRKKLGLAETPYFPILHFLENVLPLTDDTFYLEVAEDCEMAGIQAEYVPSLNVIRVRQSVYDAAAHGHWWARSTLAHELGHYYYHDDQSVRYAKLDPFERVPPDFDPERQANIFSAELLAPIHLIKDKGTEKIGDEFGVPNAVAKNQIRTLAKIKGRQDRKKAQKKKRLSSKPNR